MIVVTQQSLKNKILKKTIFFILVLISPTFSIGQESIEDISFNVYRNDSKIGYHKLNFEKEEDRIIASIEIKFDVKFLGFTLYDYFHKNKEVWIDLVVPKDIKPKVISFFQKVVYFST